jgi:DNA-binding transcriptional regulator YiaG
MALHFAFAVGLEFSKTPEEALSLILIRVLKSLDAQCNPNKKSLTMLRIHEFRYSLNLSVGIHASKYT